MTIKHDDDGFCRLKVKAWWALTQKLLGYLRVLIAMSCMTGLTVVRKACVEALEQQHLLSRTEAQDEEEVPMRQLNITRKFLSVGLIVMVTGLVEPMVGAVSKGIHTPVLGDSDVQIIGAAGCP